MVAVEHIPPVSLGHTSDVNNHAQTHEHAHHEAPISHTWKWLTVGGNVILGVGEVLTGSVNTLAVTADGLHNLGDAATYYMQSEALLNTKMSEEKRQKQRKLAHWIIAATSAGMSIKAGMDIPFGHEEDPSILSLYTASASLALNGLLLAKLQRNKKNRTQSIKHSHHHAHEHDLTKHFWAVDIPSAGLAVAGAALQKYNVDISQAAAIASGLLGTWAFRPTKKNLAHDCALEKIEALEHSQRGKHRKPKAPLFGKGHGRHRRN